jgi:hypothetical protein
MTTSNMQSIQNVGSIEGLELIKTVRKESYLANALSNPGAMMIKAEDAVVTNGAMRAAGWAIQHASVTVLCFH